MYAVYRMRKGNNSPKDGINLIGIKTPSFLSVLNSPITDSGIIELQYNNTALPISSGGTGTTSVGSQGQILSVISTEPAELGWVDGNGIGTVTSVSITVPEFLNVSPASITSSGSFDISLSSQPIPISSGGTGLTTLGQPTQILSVDSTGASLEFTTPQQFVTSISLTSTTPFLTVSQEPITSSGVLSIDCTTIPVSHGGTGLTTLGQPNQSLAVNSTGTALEFTTPNSGTVTSVALSSTTPFLTVSQDSVTSNGILSIDCTTIPVSHGGTGLTTLGLPSQILSVDSTGTSLEFTTPQQFVNSVSLSSTTPFLTVSQDPVTSSGVLSIDCDTIPVSNGGTGLTAPGQPDQILTSDGTSLYWADPPVMDQYLTTIETISPLASNDGKLFISSFTGTGKVVYENSPVLTSPILGDATCSSINVKGSESGLVRISSKSGSYNFIVPESIGRPKDILTSQGPFVPTSWSSTIGSGDLLRAPAGSQGQILSVISETPLELGWVDGSGTGTVTSVSMTVPEFLNVSPASITSSGSFDISFSSQPIPISSGGTGLTTLGQPNQTLAVNSTGTALEFTTPNLGTVTSVSISSTTPFLTVSQDSITSTGALSIDCTTIPVSHGGTGLTNLGLPAQILSVDSTGTALEFITPQQSVTSVSLSSTTPFLTVSQDPITLTGALSIDCTTIPVTHGGTGLTTLGQPTQILTVDSTGTSLEFTTPQQFVNSVSLSSTTPFVTVSQDPITSSGVLSIDCDTIPVSHGGTGLTTLGQVNQLLTSNGTSMQWVDPPNLNQYLTTIETVSPFSYTNGTLSISAFTGSGNVVYDTHPVLNSPILTDPTTNNVTVSGSQSGSVTIKAVSGDYNFILPTSLGTSGQILTSNGIFNSLQWTSTSGSGDIVRAQNSVLTGQTILTNGTVICKSALVQSKGITSITESINLSVNQFISLLTIDSENSITLTLPTCEQFNEFMGDFTIGNRLETLIHNKCPELIITAPEGITIIDGRSSLAIPVQTCTYVMTNATQGLLLIK
jgi:hypothetical protein